MASWLGRVFAAAAVAILLAGCQVAEFADVEKHLAPIPTELTRKMAKLEMDERAPIMVRIYKEDSALEVWKETASGEYALLKTYDICKWSGEFGPKFKEGDRQSPEGFYMVHPYQMNPNSSYHLSFDLGFPNAYDRARGRTGTYLMVHGACSSRGCYSMEDAAIEEIYSLARESFRGGQQAFQVQAFPFRMTPQNLAKHAGSEHLPFWQMLKEGADHFEVTRRVPQVGVCGRRYVFNAKPESGSFSPTSDCPSFTVPEEIMIAVASKQREDLKTQERMVASLERRKQREASADAREAAIARLLGGGGSESGAGREATDGAAMSAARVDFASRTTGVTPADHAATPASAAVPSAAAAASATEMSPPTATATVAAPVVIAGIPVPRASPRAQPASRSRDRGRFFRIPSIFGGDDDEPAAFASSSVTAYQATDGAGSDAIRALTPRRRTAEGGLPGVADAADVPVPPAARAAPATAVAATTTASASAGPVIAAGADASGATDKPGFFGRAWKRASGVFN